MSYVRRIPSLPAAWLCVGVLFGVGIVLFGILGLVLLAASLVWGVILHRRHGFASFWAAITGLGGIVAALIWIDTALGGACTSSAKNIPIVGGGEYVGEGGVTTCKDVVSSHWSMVFLFALTAVFAACWPAAKKQAAENLARKEREKTLGAESGASSAATSRADD